MISLLNKLAQVSIDPNELDIPRSELLDGDASGLYDTVLPVVFAVAGVVAMLVIVIAGIQFMLSRGDPQKAATARNAVIYAVIGLTLSTLAFSIVRFIAERVG